MKNANDTIGNRTRDLPACSATAPPISYFKPDTFKEPAARCEIPVFSKNITVYSRAPLEKVLYEF
jgi:hypothetical protein